MRDPAPADVDLGHLGFREVDAVGQERARHQQPVGVEAAHQVHAVAGTRVEEIDGVLGGVDVEGRARALAEVAEAVQALRREGEAGVAADHPAGQGRAHRLEGLVLLEAEVTALAAVAVGHLVAEGRAQPHLLDRAAQLAQRSPDERRRGMVIDEQRGARERRLDGSHEAGEVDGLRVQGPVQAPPHPLQDLDEAAGRDARAGHAARQRAVEVGVGVDEAGQDDGAREVEDLFARAHGERRTALHDAVAFHPEVGRLRQRRVERRHRRALEQHRRRFYAADLQGGERPATRP